MWRKENDGIICGMRDLVNAQDLNGASFLTNTYGTLLIALLIASSCLAGAQSQPQVAIITGEIREPTSREITFSYPPPSALGSSRQRVTLDSQDRFACEIPVVRGTLVGGYYEGGQPKWKWAQWLGAFLFDHSPLVFFVEPGDSLHVAVEEGFFGPSYSFSGPNADNSRFIAEWFPRFYSFRLDYEDLELEDFKRQIDLRRQEQFEFLTERREQYALSPGFIDYATAYFNYGWASRMISYPRNYWFANGDKNEDITPEYYGFLQEISLVDEKAIGVGNYHTFLVSILDWELNKEFRPFRLYDLYDLSGLELSEATEVQLDSMYQANQAQLDSLYEHRESLRLSEEIDLSGLGLSEATLTQLDSIYKHKKRRIMWDFLNRYDLAKEKLEGRVLYWFLAGVLIDGFEKGSAALELAHRRWEDFQQINPHPEYTEAVQAALDNAPKPQPGLQPGQPAPEFTLHDLDGQPVSLSQFKGQVVLLDFWASWCEPCISDLPDLRKIKEKTADWPVVFLNVSIDTDEAAWREAIDKHEIKGVHVRTDDFGSDVAKSYQVDGIPAYYLVDSQGLIVERLRIRETYEIMATIEKSL